MTVKAWRRAWESVFVDELHPLAARLSLAAKDVSVGFFFCREHIAVFHINRARLQLCHARGACSSHAGIRWIQTGIQCGFENGFACWYLNFMGNPIQVKNYSGRSGKSRRRQGGRIFRFQERAGLSPGDVYGTQRWFLRV